MFGSPEDRHELLFESARSFIVLMMLAIKSLTGKPSILDKRTEVLFASIGKIARELRVIEALAENLYVEEIIALTRTMSEVAVNAAYLQSADDEEVLRFVTGDVFVDFKGLTKQKSISGLDVDDEFWTELATKVRDLGTMIGRDKSERSWTSKNIRARALAADSHLSCNLMVEIVDGPYHSGHGAVHGTYTSLKRFTLNHPTKEHLGKELRTAMRQVCTVLYNFTKYINQLIHANIDEEIDIVLINHYKEYIDAHPLNE